jgi:small-conductance mechanosensitive channel
VIAIGFAALWQVAAPTPTAAELLERLSTGRVITAVLILLAAFVFVRVLLSVLTMMEKRAPRARFFFRSLAPFGRFLIWLGAAVLILLAVVAPTGETLLAVLAAAGIAIGFGAQDFVRNVIGGLAILVDRPFQLGDRVRIGDAYGEIDHIGLRHTKLTTTDDTRVVIPNSDVLSGFVWNSNSGNLDQQVITDLYLPHDSDAVEAMSIATEAAYSSPYILLSKPVTIRWMDGFKDGPYCVLRIKAYVYDHRFERSMQTDLTVRVKNELLRRGMLLRWSRHDAGPGTLDRRAASHAQDRGVD